MVGEGRDSREELEPCLIAEVVRLGCDYMLANALTDPLAWLALRTLNAFWLYCIMGGCVHARVQLLCLCACVYAVINYIFSCILTCGPLLACQYVFTCQM